MEVGHRLVDRLVEHGVQRVFGVPGGQTASFYNGLALRRDKIEHVLMRDERSASFAADAYARLTGRIGVCDATVGPGATNLVSGLVEAFAASVPLLAIVPDIPRGWEHRRHRGPASQAVEQRDFLEPCVKWYGRVDVPEALDAVLDNAIRVATSGRPGPVVLEIPYDVMVSEATATPAIVGASGRVPRHRSAPDPVDVQQAAKALAASSKPLILAGGGAHISGAYDEVQGLADALGAPVATTISGKGIISERHPLSIGIAGGFGSAVVNDALLSTDCVVVVGCKLGQVTTLEWQIPRPGTTIVHIDVDGEELGRHYSSTIGLESDATLGVRALLGELDDNLPKNDWDLAALREGADSWWDEDHYTTETDDGMKPQDVMRQLTNQLTNDDIVVTDASLSSGWVCSRWRMETAGRRYLAPRGVAALGWGLPAAVGAAFGMRDLGLPGRLVCVSGDGGWGFSLGEIEVLSRFGVPLVSIVLNNGTLAWNKHAVTRSYEEYVSQDFSPVSWSAAAEALGGWGARVEDIDSFPAALRSAFEVTDKPAVIEVLSSQIETPWVPAASLKASSAY